MSYGIYNNATEFYNNLQINNKVKYKKSDNTTEIGTIISLSVLGVKCIVIITNKKNKYIIFPKNAHMLEIYE